MGKKTNYTLHSKVHLYPGMEGSASAKATARRSGLHILVVDKKTAVEIKETHGARARGWGSLPVEAKIGKTIWTTSIFPEKKSGTYLLPLKAAIRKAEDLFADDEVAFSIKILV